MPPATARIEARPARAPDLHATAALHELALPHGFFAQLGPRFLAHYHETFVASPHAAALVVIVDAGIVGFLVGPTDSTAHYQWVARRRGVRLARAALLALLRRPRLWVPFLQTRLTRYLRSLRRLLRRRGGAADVRPSDGAPPPDVAVLTHVAVAPTHRGRRIGAVLVEAFTQACREAGADEIRLITDVATGGRGFYQRLGWAEVTERPASDGSLVIEFRRDLTEDWPR